MFGPTPETLQQRQGKTGGLASSGLSHPHDVTTLKDRRDCAALYRGRFVVALFGNGFEQLGAQAEIRK